MRNQKKSQKSYWIFWFSFDCSLKFQITIFRKGLLYNLLAYIYVKTRWFSFSRIWLARWEIPLLQSIYGKMKRASSIPINGQLHFHISGRYLKNFTFTADRAHAIFIRGLTALRQILLSHFEILSRIISSGLLILRY